MKRMQELSLESVRLSGMGSNKKSLDATGVKPIKKENPQYCFCPNHHALNDSATVPKMQVVER
jgi:hypothetical protein